MKKIFTLLFAATCTANVMAANDENVVKYDFEHFKVVEDKFHQWFEVNKDGSEAEIWATANLPFAIMNEGGPETYPTASDANGYEGACVKLETKSTGPLGAMFGMPIAAGNMFTGELDAENCVMDALGSTHFGIQFNRKPLKISGYYKYKAGEKLTDVSGAEVAGTDKGSIYSVLYRNTDADGKPFVLNGKNIEGFTNPQIVAMANVGEVSDAEDWTKFEVEYNYGENEIDADMLASGGYNLAVVFSSSINGGAFIGAVGSTLYVDNVAIECEPEPATKVFTDDLKVNVNGDDADPSKVSISITKQDDGKYTLSLKNFYLVSAGDGMPIGTITVKDIEGEEKDGYTSLKAENRVITIENGDDEGVETWMGPLIGEVPISLDAKMTSNKLYAVIVINANIMGAPMDIKVVFGSDPTGINNVTTNNNGIEGIFDLNGAKVNNMQSGKVYIIRKANGTTKKVMNK